MPRRRRLKEWSRERIKKKAKKRIFLEETIQSEAEAGLHKEDLRVKHVFNVIEKRIKGAKIVGEVWLERFLVDREVAKLLGVKPQSKVVDIYQFYPHSEGLTRERKGVGTAAFEKAIEIAKKKLGAKALTLSTTNITLRNIALKQGFKVIEERSILTPKGMEKFFLLIKKVGK